MSDDTLDQLQGQNHGVWGAGGTGGGGYVTVGGESIPQVTRPSLVRYKMDKTYGHDLGLSCVFRNWRDDSHCSFIHGYALGFKIGLSCSKLDARGWVWGFGKLKPFKQWLIDTFDHKHLIAADDPDLDLFIQLRDRKATDLRFVPGIGCEAFAQYAYTAAKNILCNADNAVEWKERRLHIDYVEVREHAGNSATYSVTPSFG